MALVAAVWGEYPMPRPAQVGISAAPASSLASNESGGRDSVTVAIAAIGPFGPGEGVPETFGWHTAAPPPFELVVLDAAYREIGRVAAIDQCSVRPDTALAERLGSGGTFHWFVLAEAQQGVVRSPLTAFEIR
ncbi:MAG: hypothetical protein KDE27_18360 [Planctomycetes bacterium]|nr:hypothetical protein [Planctomycetota bacterium]